MTKSERPLMYIKPKYLFSLIVCIGLTFGTTLSVTAQVARSEGPKKVVLLEGLQVEGKIEKPEVFLLLTRHRIEFKRLELKKSFLKEIMESVRRNPF